MHVWIPIAGPKSLDRLISEIDDEDYAIEDVVILLREALAFDIVKAILIETSYVDKDYRSTYYSFYAKKGLRYNPFCIRLHFFKEGISFDGETDLTFAQGNLREYYVGYMVLRPTPRAPVGRTVLSVAARDAVRGGVIQAAHHVHFLGYRTEVEGFPYMQQHSDISVCAHAACWSILRHLSQKHRCYAEFLVTDITKMASPTNPGGLLPSRGLNLEQVARVFSLARLFPDTYFKEDAVNEREEPDPVRFYRRLNAYVESGLPVFAALFKRPHAITVVGQGPIDRTAFNKSTDPILFEWDAINAFIVVDDNYMPYKPIDCLTSQPYRITDIEAFVVPLPEKVYLPAEAAEAQILGVLQSGYALKSNSHEATTEDETQLDSASRDAEPGASEPLRLDFGYLKQPVIRHFLTTASSFRAFARKVKSAYPAELFRAIMDLTLPQFVWVAQVSSLSDWIDQRASVTFLLDATASALDEDPFFLVHDDKRAFLYDRGETRDRGWITFPQPLLSVPAFRENLIYRT